MAEDNPSHVFVRLECGFVFPTLSSFLWPLQIRMGFEKRKDGEWAHAWKLNNTIMTIVGVGEGARLLRVLILATYTLAVTHTFTSTAGLTHPHSNHSLCSNATVICTAGLLFFIISPFLTSIRVNFKDFSSNINVFCVVIIWIYFD